MLGSVHSLNLPSYALHTALPPVLICAQTHSSQKDASQLGAHSEALMLLPDEGFYLHVGSFSKVLWVTINPMSFSEIQFTLYHGGSTLTF